MATKRPKRSVRRGPKGVSCPLQKACALKVVSPKTMLVECRLLEPGRCSNAFKVGDRSYCEALFSTRPR